MKKTSPSLLLLLCLLTIKSQAQNCSPPTQKAHLNVNNVDATLLNGDDMWWDLISRAGYVVPKDSGISSEFTGALWIGGIDPGGQLHLAAGTYRQNGSDWFPGPLDNNGTTTSNTCNVWDKMWTVFSSDIRKRDSIALAAGVTFGPPTFGSVSQTQVPQNLLDWPAKGNPYNSIAGQTYIAPFYDVDGDGLYDPTKGDYPVVNDCGYADQMVFWVINDRGNIHSESGGLPLGAEVHILAFAFKSNDEINDMTFYKYTLEYKGATQLDSVFISFWDDPDLGCMFDDYIGCDTARNMGIVYNADAFDGPGCPLEYGNQPPILGVNFLCSNGFPSNEPFRMAKFGYYNNDFTPMGNPERTQDYYNYMTGSWKDSTRWTLGGQAHGGSTTTNYVFQGRTDIAGGWSECQMNDAAGDRRFLMSSGPHHLNSGDNREFYTGVVWVRPPVGTYPCPSLSLLQQAADKAKSFVCQCTNYNGIASPDFNSKATVTLFPNPTDKDLILSNYPSSANEAEIKDVLGRTVLNQTISLHSASTTLNVSALPSGIYFALVRSKEYIYPLISS